MLDLIPGAHVPGSIEIEWQWVHCVAGDTGLGTQSIAEILDSCVASEKCGEHICVWVSCVEFSD